MDHKPDYALELTALGRQQALDRGKQLKQLIGEESVQWYISPYFRTRQTFLGIRESFTPPFKAYEDPRLREQDWGNWRKGVDYNQVEEARDTFGHFYYRLPSGESCADVWSRYGGFLNTLYRDFQKPDYAQNAVIVTHGMTMRVAIARHLHYTIEDFEMLANPENCGIFILQKNARDRYDLVGEPRRYAKLKHPYQFKWPEGGLTGQVK
jgi:broad specificity phosphatase PhoE